MIGFWIRPEPARHPPLGGSSRRRSWRQPVSPIPRPVRCEPGVRGSMRVKRRPAPGRQRSTEPHRRRAAHVAPSAASGCGGANRPVDKGGLRAGRPRSPACRGAPTRRNHDQRPTREQARLDRSEARPREFLRPGSSRRADLKPNGKPLATIGECNGYSPRQAGMKSHVASVVFHPVATDSPKAAQSSSRPNCPRWHPASMARPQALKGCRLRTEART